MASNANVEVKVRKRRFVEKPDVRTKFLDAAEDLIRSEGYAAASVRAIAQRVGMKHQAIFYYFGSQDELLLELFRRAARLHRERLAIALQSASPVRAMWDLARDAAATGLAIEFMALANHNEVIRAEIARNATEVRHLESAGIEAHLKRRGIVARVSPEIVSILTNAAARLLVQESILGIEVGHKMYEDLVELSFRAFEQDGETSPDMESIVNPMASTR